MKQEKVRRIKVENFLFCDSFIRVASPLNNGRILPFFSFLFFIASEI
jgi:hypothetical protein